MKTVNNKYFTAAIGFALGAIISMFLGLGAASVLVGLVAAVVFYFEVELSFEYSISRKKKEKEVDELK